MFSLHAATRDTLDRFSWRVLVSSANVGRHSQSLANISQQLFAICLNTYMSLSLSLYICRDKKIFRTDIARKSNTNVYVSHTHFSWNPDYSEIIKIMCMICNSLSWEPLNLIQVLYQSCDHKFVISQVRENSIFNKSGTLRDSLHAGFFFFLPYFFISYERASRFSCHESNI